MLLFQSLIHNYGFYLFVLVLFVIGIWLERERQRNVQHTIRSNGTNQSSSTTNRQTWELHEFKSYFLAHAHLKLDQALTLFAMKMYKSGQILSPHSLDVKDENKRDQYIAATKLIIYRLNGIQDTYEGEDYINAMMYADGLRDSASEQMILAAERAIKTDYHKKLYQNAAQRWNAGLLDEEDDIELPYSYRTPMASRVSRKDQ